MDGERRVRVLESDPELGLRVAAGQIGQARAELVAPSAHIDHGLWDVPERKGDRSKLGFLMLEGVVARNVILAGTTCTELVGEGDFLQPMLPSRDNLLPYRVQWQVIEPARVAILDEEFTRLLGRWPGVMSVMLEREVRRTLRMSIHQALLQLSPLETRLLILFWHLAESWGRVTPGGIKVRLRLSHELLGHLVGAKRASVTTALRHVGESGRLVRRSDGSWLLRGSPPAELDRLRWGAHATTGVGLVESGISYA